ncbi:MAG: hypothetical protein C4530_20825 [Desulfobacteraceae bacterium]|nr:MAG: hypothetical protein C4530_20825 [Desulfobacteraceae bacterium]
MKMKSFRNIVEAFVRSPNDNLMAKLIDNIEQSPPTDEDIAFLALNLSKSGKSIRDLKGATTADIPSTGGPSSLSTILCPLYLRALGYVVPKLGIPGRPAGGIDVLAQIKGYKIDFTGEEIEQHLKNHGYVHFIAGDKYAPLDAILFEYRKRFNKINIPELAIASILSKKLAAAVSLVGLDVRVAPHGNFGTSFDTASEYSKQFCRVAKILGLKTVCFLSDANIPYQPFIGRGESLAAVYHILTNQVDPWLCNHNDACYAMVNRLIHFNHNDSIVRPSSSVLLSVFEQNLKNQGSSFDHFENYVEEIMNGHNLQLLAPESGFIHVNLDLLRSLIVGIQNKFISSEKLFPDPCGVILKHSSGAYVYKNDVIATIRCSNNLSDKVLIGVQSSIRVMNETFPGIHFKEVTHV